ncbi:uncharacterized protein LOC128554859 [Mercenaria mercenaria]|uniref:uncharacterized protein LOC128554859 n=1 Tax=Mercenaria mercenaria TaxID=6596 RepID=UPI00234F00D5|nr:uncharacterized protein LOC128554859 [Mercenaria mercenaria]
MYIQEYFEMEGILLEYDKIEENPGLRLLAKIMLNSFWGKFGQCPNLTQTSFIDDPVQFIDMMNSDKQEIKNVRFINEEEVQLDSAYNNDFIEASCRTNVVVAAYTTAQARLKLYSYLQPLGDRVLYCDTDSVVFTSAQGEWDPPLGDFLGDLTDEVPYNQITKFVTGGPKNYAFCLARPNKKGQSSICKRHGIEYSGKNVQVVHHMISMISLDTERRTDSGEQYLENIASTLSASKKFPTRKKSDRRESLRYATLENKIVK